MFLETFESWTERIHLANQLISLGFLLRLFFARQLVLFSGIKLLVEGPGIEVEHLPYNRASRWPIIRFTCIET
jgi:hypothetical protein